MNTYYDIKGTWDGNYGTKLFIIKSTCVLFRSVNVISIYDFCQS